MKIASVDHGGERRFGRVVEDGLELIAPSADPLTLLDPQAEHSWDGTIPFDPNGPLNPPLPVTSLRDFITFEQHTAGSLKGVRGTEEIPEAWFRAPAFYFTNPHAATGSGRDVPMAPGTAAWDVELEVGAVIGRAGYNLTPDEAWDHIAGLTIFNDWSARDVQGREMEVGLGPTKGKDTATTLGPVIVTLDELEDKRVDDMFDLAMDVSVNGEKLGGDTLASMAWSFAELVSYASRGTWVRPGDVLGSGTCGGGCLVEYWGWTGRQDPPPLQAGDVVTMTVEGIGTIHNRVTEAAPLHELPPARRKEWQRPAR